MIVLGSTGSIGTQTLGVIEHLNTLAERGGTPPGARGVRYEVVGLAAGGNEPLLREQAARFGVRQIAAGAQDVAMGGSGVAAERLVRSIGKRQGDEDRGADLVLAAIVGAAGVRATLAAAELGIDIALANKESLVAAGELVVGACRQSGARLLPVDSEHAALWQALMSFAGPGFAPPGELPQSVSRLVLTASGGPFRDAGAWPIERLARVTAAQAMEHPTWDMGPKVTVDCASLMNKAMELLEAHWLFGVGADRLGAVVHPQSVVHSMVEGVDGSVIAQLGPTDMRAPIQQALTFPERTTPASGRLAIEDMGRLDFAPPDETRFGALALARRVMTLGGTSGAVFNGANEAAVRAFLGGRLGFMRITELAGAAIEELGASAVNSLDDVMTADAAARAFVERHVGRESEAVAPSESGR